MRIGKKKSYKTLKKKYIKKRVDQSGSNSDSEDDVEIDLDKIGQTNPFVKEKEKSFV